MLGHTVIGKKTNSSTSVKDWPERKINEPEQMTTTTRNI